jgi:deoxyribose-phosphate aldolase
MNKHDIARKIQHTLLKITATSNDIKKLCDEAVKYDFQAVCVQPMWAELAVSQLENTNSVVCAVADFPHGAGGLKAKSAEVADLVAKGVEEIDVVCKIGYLRSGMFDEFRDDLAAVVNAANGKITKVILETSILNDEELRRAIELAIEAKMDYIKTASGFNGPGATVEIIKKMSEIAAGKIKVKAAGGIRSWDDAVAMVEAGADVLGASSGVAIITGGQSEGAY